MKRETSRPRDAFDATRARHDIRQARDRGKIFITFTRYGAYNETEETPLVILVRERAVHETRFAG